MKKILILTTFLLLGYNSQAQEPTKQETLDWIAGKLKECIKKPYLFSGYRDGIFEFRTDGISKITLDLNKITKWKVGDCNYSPPGEGLGIEGIDFAKTLYDNGQVNISSSWCIGKGESDIDVVTAGLAERMGKALDVLVKYNTQKTVGEKF